MRFSFKQNDFVAWQKLFADYLGIPVKNKKAQINDQRGHGWIYADSIDDSISFVAIDIKTNEELTFHRKSNQQNGLIIFFNQIQISRSFKIRNENHVIIEHKKERNNVYISSSKKDIEFTYSASSHLRRLGFYLSPQWLKAHQQKKEQILIYDVMDEELSNVDLFRMNAEIEKIMWDVFENNFEKETDQQSIKIKALILLNYLFQSFFCEKENNAAAIKRRKLELENLRKVENLLTKEVAKPYPSIAKLSRIAQMSSTRLKQRFREIYGYGIYKFYNKERLQKAADMLRQGIPIKQAAMDVGYGNASNFTKAFKKEFDITPGQISKQNNRLQKIS